MKKIYVSYFFKNNEKYGISNAIIKTKNFKKIEDIANIEATIAQNYEFSEVKLISWQQI